MNCPLDAPRTVPERCRQAAGRATDKVLNRPVGPHHPQCLGPNHTAPFRLQTPDHRVAPGRVQGIRAGGDDDAAGRRTRHLGRQTHVSLAGGDKFSDAPVDAGQRDAATQSPVFEMDSSVGDLDGPRPQRFTAGQVARVPSPLVVADEPHLKALDADHVQRHVAAPRRPGRVNQAEPDRQRVGPGEQAFAVSPAARHLKPRAS